jgi:hypothetical protein
MLVPTVAVGIGVPRAYRMHPPAGDPQDHHVRLEYYAPPRRIQTIRMVLHRSITPPLATRRGGQIGRDRLVILVGVVVRVGVWRRGICRI